VSSSGGRRAASLIEASLRTGESAVVGLGAHGACRLGLRLGVGVMLTAAGAAWTYAALGQRLAWAAGGLRCALGLPSGSNACRFRCTRIGLLCLVGGRVGLGLGARVGLGGFPGWRGAILTRQLVLR